jgi:hypothetical protein
MAFLGGNTDNMKFALTKLGEKTLTTKGLEKQIFYYTLYDDGINYQLDAFPYLVLDINGSKKTIVPDSIIFDNKLIA